MGRLRHTSPRIGDRLRGRLVTPENKRWWALAAVSPGPFMIMLDATLVNVALPAIRGSLHMELADLASPRQLALSSCGGSTVGLCTAMRAAAEQAGCRFCR